VVRCLLHNWSVAAWRWRPRVAPFEYRIYCETENIFPGTANLQTLVRPPAMKEWHRGAAILALQWGQFREKSTSGPFIGPPTRGNVSNERSLQWGRAVRRASLLRTIGVGDVSFAPPRVGEVESPGENPTEGASSTREQCRIETRDYRPVGELEYSKTPVLDGKRSGRTPEPGDGTTVRSAR